MIEKYYYHLFRRAHHLQNEWQNHCHNLSKASSYHHYLNKTPPYDASPAE